MNGSRNTNSNAITTIGNVYINTPGIAAANPGSLYVNRVNPDTADVRIGSDATNLYFRTQFPSAAQITGYPSLQFYKWTNANYVEYNGNDFFPSPTNTLNLGLSTNHWNNFYTNTINSDSTRLRIGDISSGITVFSSGGADSNIDTEIRANGNRRLALNSTGQTGANQYLYWDGSAAFAYPLSASLGVTANPWANLYVNQVNPATFTPSPGSTRYATYDSSAEGIVYLPNPGLAGTYSIYIQLVGGGGGAGPVGGGGGGAFTGVAITGVAVGTRYDYVCGGGGATSTTSGNVSSIYFPSLFLQYAANPGGAAGSGSGGTGGNAQSVGGNIVSAVRGGNGSSSAGGLGGLAGATYLGRGGNPANGVGVAGYISIDTVFVPTPITVNNTLTGTTRLDQLLIKPGLGGGIGLLANSDQIVFGTNGSLNTGKYLYWNGSDLGPSLTNTTDLGAPAYRWDNLYVNTINPNGTNTSIGGTTGFTVQAGATVLLQKNSGANQIGFGTGSGGSYNAIWNGGTFFPSVTNQGALGAANATWSNIWVNAINPTSITLGNYTIVDSSTPATGSYTLQVGYTYTISAILVGAGGGGVHWLNYTPVSNAGGGSGAYINRNITGVAGGTVITWTIGDRVGGNNGESPSSLYTNSAAASGYKGGNTDVNIIGYQLMAAAGGNGGIARAVRVSNIDPWTDGTPSGGNGGSPIYVSGVTGNTGGVSSFGYPSGASGGVSVYGGYGFGGDANGGNSGYGYVKIIAIPTTTTPITNRLLGNTQIDSSIYTTTNMSILAVNTSTNNITGLNIGSSFILPIGNTGLGSAAYKFTALGANVLYTNPPIIILLAAKAGGYTGSHTIDMSVLARGFWLVHAYGDQNVGDMLAMFSITIPISTSGILLGGAMQLNASVNTSVDPTNQKNFIVNLGSVVTSVAWQVYARPIMYTQ